MAIQASSSQSASYLRSLLNAYSRSQSSTKASLTSQPSINRNEFIGRLEQHLNDYKKGKGYLSSEVSAQISNLGEQNSLALANPKDARLYNGYITAFSYNQKARFIDGVNTAATSLNNIDPAKASKDAEDFIKSLNLSA